MDPSASFAPTVQPSTCLLGKHRDGCTYRGTRGLVFQTSYKKALRSIEMLLFKHTILHFHTVHSTY